MDWKQSESQRDPSDFLKELKLTVSKLPRLPGRGKRVGLELVLRNDIVEGHPIPNSYHIEPVLTELVRKPGIIITCFSDREHFGSLPEGLILEPEVGNPYAENLRTYTNDL